MSKIRIALVSALTIASVLAGGVAVSSHTASPRPAHHLAGPGACCEDDGVMHV
jgi:hypothetical protein